jgi:integrase
MARRANGEGSIIRRGDGQWQVAARLSDGRRRYLYARSREDAVRKLRELVQARDASVNPTANGDTVGEFLAQWLAGKKPTVRLKTWERYRQYIENNAIPRIGRVTLKRLSPQDLQRLYGELLESGLSSTTVHHVHLVLHNALQAAFRWGLVQRNVATLTEAPRMRTAEMRVLNPDQCRYFLKAIRGDELEALYVLAITTGMRQGELLALRWRDVDLVRGIVAVTSTLERVSGRARLTEPKTHRSRRPVILPELARDALHKHRQRQATVTPEALGSEYQFIFQSRVGGPLDHSHLLQRRFYPLLERAGLPRIRFHDLRHTAATAMLRQGVHPKVAAEMLGHSDPTTTLRIYSHVSEAMHHQAAAAIDQFFAPQ